MGENHNGWDIWGKAVLGDLKEIKESAKEQAETTTKLLIGLAELKTQFKMKSGIWGAIGGLVPILLGLSIYLIRSIL